LYSLDKSEADIEKSWIAESKARYEAHKRGELGLYDWDEIDGSEQAREAAWSWQKRFSGRKSPETVQMIRGDRQR
jgi:hypothetical protein